MPRSIFPFSRIRISRKFLRSVRVDFDFGREDALQGYVLQESAKSVLENTARHVNRSRQRAFTWTGPYGGGKSSLALALASLAGGTELLRNQAKKALGVKSGELHTAFCGPLPWTVVPVVGKRASIQDEIAIAIDRHKSDRTSSKPVVKRGRKPRRNVIEELQALARNKRSGGVLLVIDELGKFLEYAASIGEDVYFYQELAEAASRSDGQLVVVGILHQAFEQYAARLGFGLREEWAKVQGRFVDMPLVAGSDETIDLIGKAIELPTGVHAPKSILPISDTVANVIRRRRPASPQSLGRSLAACWPLHPVTAALLGPSSKRRFGQNDRSIFGFLGSAEPLAFTEFLQGTSDPAALYTPAMYWDYLKANLEPAILASADGHRWALGAEAVERTEVKFGSAHVTLVKTVALIELFRNGSGLAAEETLLASCGDLSARAVNGALSDLAKGSILIYRKHIDGWGVYAGSDFDIEAAVQQAISEQGDPELRHLADLGDLHPVTARRHYWETGAMRWFSRDIARAADISKRTGSSLVASGACGRFVLLMPQAESAISKIVIQARELSSYPEANRVVFGVPHNSMKLLALARDVDALSVVRKSRPEIDGDSVARREIDARIAATRSQLSDELRGAFSSAKWYWQGERMQVNPGHGLSPLASQIADAVFSKTPRLINELVNRDDLSSSAAKARKDLLHRMLEFGDRPDLGYDGYPADAGLYYSILKSTGLHRLADTSWQFCAPDSSPRGATLHPLWVATQHLLESGNNPIALSSIYSLWREEPFGVKAGLLPILACAFFLAHRTYIGLYVEGVFTPELTEADLDEWLQDSRRISWRFVRLDAGSEEMLNSIAHSLNQRLGREIAPDPLDAARALVALMFQLPEWAKRTALVSSEAQRMRNLLLKASDPHKVLFADLPATLDLPPNVALATKLAELAGELVDAYPRVLKEVIDRVLHAIDHQGEFEKLNNRAKAISGISGDFRLDAFTARLSIFSGSATDIEGLMMLALNKPTTQWADRDLDAAVLQLTAWAMEFRRVEALASVRDRPAGRRAFAVVFGASTDHVGKTVSGTFDVATTDAAEIENFVADLLASAATKNMKREIFLAGLAEAGARLVEDGKRVEEH